MEPLNREQILAYFATLSNDELNQLYASTNQQAANNETSSPEKHVKQAPKSVKKLDEERVCPLCKSNSVVKYGTQDGKQRYKCKSCKNVFRETKNSITHGSHCTTEEWKLLIKDTIKGVSIDDSADKLDRHHETVFNMRHKILMAIEEMNEKTPVVLSDVSELDETYVQESYKGTKKWIYARNPRKRGEKANKRGLSNEKICICTGIQRGGKALLRTVNRAKPSNEELHKVFDGHIAEDTLILVDGLKGYKSLHETNSCQVVNAKKQKASFYHLNNVNGLHSQYKERYHKYRGVATKYINRYNAMIGAGYKSDDEVIDSIYEYMCEMDSKDRHVPIGDIQSKNVLEI